MIIGALLCATIASGATYKQASQAWVNMKLAQLEARIMANVTEAAQATNETQEAAAIVNSAQTSISEGYDIGSVITSTSAWTPTNGTPYYTVGIVNAELPTTLIKTGDSLRYKETGIYTNSVCTLTEGSLTNTLTVSGLPFFAPVGAYVFRRIGNTGEFIVAAKYFTGR